MIKTLFINSKDPLFDEVKKIRSTVFTDEQGANADEEFDDYDNSALFCLASYDDKFVATSRLALTEKGYKIGRIAVLKQYRSIGLGAKVVRAVLDKAFENESIDCVYVDAQLHAVPFYEKLGFSECGKQIVDRGLLHLPMKVERNLYYAKKEEQ